MYNYCVSRHYAPSCFLLNLKHTVLQRLDSVSILRWNLLSWVQLTEPAPISGHHHQHKIGYINQAQHKPSVRVKTNIKNIKKTPHNFVSVCLNFILWEQKI
jgi:hypothetical protein